MIGVARIRDEGPVMGRTEGAALFNRGYGPTEAIWRREEPVNEAKLQRCAVLILAAAVIASFSSGDRRDGGFRLRTMYLETVN